jgi:hypothetical protein
MFNVPMKKIDAFIFPQQPDYKRFKSAGVMLLDFPLSLHREALLAMAKRAYFLLKPT